MLLSQYRVRPGRPVTGGARRAWIHTFLVTAVACLLVLGISPGSAAAPPSLEPGMIVEGALTSDDPTLADGSHYDVYQISVQAGEVVRLYLASDEIDPYLLLRDRSGVPWSHDDDSGSGSDALIDEAVPSKGTWEVVVNSYGSGETGAYLLAWAPPGARFLTRGSPAAGELTAHDPILPEAYRHGFIPQDGAYHDLYLLVGRQGEVVRLAMESSEVDAYLLLVDAEGNLLVDDDDSGGGSDALLEYTLPSTGVYRVLATSFFSGQTGRYTLNWSDAQGVRERGGEGEIVLTPGASVEGELTPDDAQLDDGTYYDLYYLEGYQGETVYLRLTSPDFDAYLMLGDEQGRRLATDDDSGGGSDAYLVHTLPEDGWYQVVVNSFFRGETGRYTLTRETTAPEAESAFTSTLAPGVAVVGRLSSGDRTLSDGTYYDIWYLQGEAGETVSIFLGSLEFDAYLMLCDETGEVIASDDDSGGGTDSYLEYTLPASGVYMVVANSIFRGETGEYTLVWEAAGDGTPAGTAGSTGETGRVDGELLPGVPVTGSTGPAPEHYRTYTLDVPEGVGSVVLTLQSKGDLDLFVRHGRQMRDWDEADFSSVTASSSETITIDQENLRPGRYYIDVADLVRGSPGHTFVLLATFRPVGDDSEPTAPSPPAEYVDGELVPGSRIQGRVALDSLARYWVIEVPPGAKTMHAGLFNAEGPLDLVAAPEGRVPITPDAFPHTAQTALNNDRLEIPVDREEAARWWIGVVSPEFAPVDYELEVRFDEPLPPYPTYEPQARALSPLDQAIAATVQLFTSQGTGSGSLVTPTGLILTNYHVVGLCYTGEPAFACSRGEPLTEPDGSLERVVVGLPDTELGVAEQLFYARLEHSLLEYDLALLRIESDLNGDPPKGPLPWVPLDASPVRLGEQVLVIGYPGIAAAGGQIPLSLTAGIVSGFTTHRGQRLLIQTDATVNAGNSGGLMIRSADGRVIGVPSDIQYNTETLEKQNYARPIALLPDLWRRLIEREGGRVIEP